MTAALVEKVLADVRAGGGRVTAARRALVGALAEAAPKAHLTAEELVSQVRSSQPDLADSTIYRLLADLEARGLARHVHTGHGAAVYHLSAAGDHLHLVCDGCGRIIDVPPTILGHLDNRLQDTHGFRLRADHIALHGLCSNCQEA